MTDATNNEEELQVEKIKLQFESFKHMTTLNTAAALVGFLLLVFGISLLASLMGMSDAIHRMGGPRRGRKQYPPPWIYFPSWLLFMSGLSAAALVPLGITKLPYTVLSGGLILSIALTVVLAFRRRGERGASTSNSEPTP
jgi:hypothetical protein